ncbi:MAG: GNAT family N-acetyltransferase [Proteobacteria bacterium]|nr:GNAT family N-acetyltransferase [Pseudomonadota bacterium]
MALVEPSLERLPGYVAALRTGWSPSTGRDVSAEQLAEIERDVARFVADLARNGAGATVTLPDGSTVERLPGLVRWMWDGSFCGAINVRHVPGTLDLPPHVSGHVGYAVVPWKRRQGIATRALALMLPIARSLGLPRILVTCDADNEASRRTILANGGVPDEACPQREEIGKLKLRFWIATG